MKKSQTERLYELLSDGQWHSTVEILEKCYGSDRLGIARISARIYDIKKKYDVVIESRRYYTNLKIWEYRMIPAVYTSWSDGSGVLTDEMMSEAKKIIKKQPRLFFLKRKS